MSAAKVQFYDPEVEVDVMESTEGDPLPPGVEDRMFALIRRWTIRTANRIELTAVDVESHEFIQAELAVASRAALIALKVISIPRRKYGNHPEKIGSDIQDLFRLVSGLQFRVLLDEFKSLDEEVRAWVATMLEKNFSPGADLRYNLARLRRYASNPDALSIGEDELVLLSEFAAALVTDK